MKTKIIMMSALLALLATGCNKEDNNGSFDGRLKIFAEEMTNASGSKLLIDAGDLTNPVQWLDGEKININGTVKDIAFNSDHFEVNVNSLALSIDGFNGYYAVYPGSNFGGNEVTVTNSNTSAIITLNKLVLNFHAGNSTHDVVFPMGGKVNEDNANQGLVFKHLTAGFRLTLENTDDSPVPMDKLKVIVYGSAGDAAGATTIDGVDYTVKWADQGPTVPTGQTGSLTDRDVSFASVMDFDLKTDGTDGMTIDAKVGTVNGKKQLCIPVTLAQVKRITVIGYNGSNVVFSKTSTLSTPPTLACNVIYPVKAIVVK